MLLLARCTVSSKPRHSTQSPLVERFEDAGLSDHGNGNFGSIQAFTSEGTPKLLIAEITSLIGSVPAFLVLLRA